MVDYSETIEVYDIKVSVNNEYMKIHVYQRYWRLKGLFDTCTFIALSETGSQVIDTGPLDLWF